MARKKASAQKAEETADVVYEYEPEQRIMSKQHGTGTIFRRRVFEGEPLYWVMFLGPAGLQYVREDDIIGLAEQQRG